LIEQVWPHEVEEVRWPTSRVYTAKQIEAMWPPPKLDRERVLRGTRRIRLALAGGEVHYGFGELVRVAGHSGALWHSRIMGPALAPSQMIGGSN
jgi:hypothetical protein